MTGASSDNGTSAELSGKTIVITGASSGIGRVGAIDLARRGATIGVLGRNAERTRAVAAEVGGTPFIADFDRLDDVRHIATALLTAFPRIDVLVNNAGGLVSTKGVTADGHERTFQHNHLAPFLLTNLLLDRLTESAGRVISTASSANAMGQVRLDDLDWKKRAWFGGWRAYGTSKTETILFIRELARRTAGTGVTAYSFHPGFVATGFGADSGLLKFGQFVSGGHLGLTPAQGAVPLIHLASEPDVGVPSGTYFDGLKADGFAQKITNDEAVAAELWAKSAEMVGLPA